MSRLNIIVPAPYQELAQQLCEAIAEGDAGAGMFTTGVSPDGSEPATHYFSSGYIDDAFAALLPLTTPSEDGDTTRPGQVEVVEGMAAEAGFELPPGTIGALFAAIDVTDYYAVDLFTRLGQLGLTITQEATE